MNLSLNDVIRLLTHMVNTGEGTDSCYEAGVLPLPVHYYSPIPDLKDLDQRNVFSKLSKLKGINMRQDEQVARLHSMAAKFGRECNWPKSPGEDQFAFYWDNGSFSFQCASLLHYFIRDIKPRRIIEIGSGMSSRVISDAIEWNKSENPDYACRYSIVDPYPSDLTRTLKNLSNMNANRVELMTVDFFSDLSANDILFIDSGHTVKTGGDVNFLFLEVLPELAPGVHIHVHDISLPAEMPRVYFSNPKFRMFWTEQYLLQAFLMFNTEFDVLASVPYLAHNVPDLMQGFFPNNVQGNMSGSFWMRRNLPN